jgi:hypothetical protein
MIQRYLFPPALSVWFLNVLYYLHAIYKGNSEAGVPKAEQRRSIRDESRKASLEEAF